MSLISLDLGAAFGVGATSFLGSEAACGAQTPRIRDIALCLSDYDFG